LTAYITGIIGAWLFSDGLLSIFLYLNEIGYHGKKQTWRRDHWIRCVRMGLGLILIGIGALEIINKGMV